MVRLLSEAAAARESAPAMKRRIASGLAALIDADAWLWAVSELSIGERFDGAFSTLLYNGLDERQLAMLYQGMYDPKLPPPEREAMTPDLIAGEHFTRRREDLVPTHEWRASGHYKQYRAPHNMDEFVCSVYPLSASGRSVVAFHRATGRPAFSVRDRRLVHVVMSELGPLHTDTGNLPLGGTPGPSVAGLSPRLRTVFGLLLEGWSRKQISEHLTLSPHTVAEYKRAIYKHFGVHSQRELQARFHQGDGGDVRGR
ncbi:MAG: LuxR family transcriptional regulator [Phycisphaerales bacterium]|nr:MAG: LuxR family transcriptional regulator [Phycisphaerales bacterium]